MKYLIIISILCAALLGIDINGKWQLSSQHPIKINGIICYSPKIEFKNDGSFHIVRKNSTSVSIVYVGSFFYTLSSIVYEIVFSFIVGGLLLPFHTLYEKYIQK